MPRIHFIERLALLLVGIVAGAALVFGKVQLALGILAGGLLSVVNFYALRALMGAIVASQQPMRQALLSVLLVLKFLAVGIAIFLLLTFLPVDAIGLILGVSTVVAAILVEGFRAALRAAPQE